MSDLKILFGKRVKKFRLKNMMSQEELAEKIDIALNNLGKIERGESFVTAQTLDKISNVLGVEVKELFNFDDFKSPNQMRKELKLGSLSDETVNLIYKIYNMVLNQ